MTTDTSIGSTDAEFVSSNTSDVRPAKPISSIVPHEFAGDSSESVDEKGRFFVAALGVPVTYTTRQSNRRIVEGSTSA